MMVGGGGNTGKLEFWKTRNVGMQMGWKVGFRTASVLLPVLRIRHTSPAGQHRYPSVSE